MAIEFAIWVPALIMASVVLIDMVRFVETSARMDRVAASVADLVTGNIEIRDHVDFNHLLQNNDLAMFFHSANVLAQPDDLIEDGRIILTSIDTSVSGHVLNWQRSGPYHLDVRSRLPADLKLPPGGTYIVAEAFLQFEPSIAATKLAIPAEYTLIYRRFIFRSRLASLSQLLPAN
ncbi:TadE/TadG family type IV pilus assembly protein [Geminicoccus roseus]|uniref:TadE/TadG family type IV pilus assembly protein n=1 Tax=Geminicoccus roseus TaxID=404900 RepID=UPI0004226146|nr:hypothetical protein [Geminicoccus roseus]